MSKDQRKFVVVVFLKNKKIKKAVNTVTNSNVVRNYIFSKKDQVTLILHTVGDGCLMQLCIFYFIFLHLESTSTVAFTLLNDMNDT